MRPLKSMDKSNYVIYLSTFSKTISLGLRIGWIVASEEVINCLKKIKQLSDLHVNTLNQHVMSEYLASNLYNEHIKYIRSAYMSKRELMVQQLNKHFDSITFNIPKGGFYLWVNFCTDFNLKELFDKCFREGVVIIPDYHFMPDNKGRVQNIRLNFTYPSEEEIVEGIKKIYKCYKNMEEATK
jgi:DNA-binding transcriptional MocR family regulator